MKMPFPERLKPDPKEKAKLLMIDPGKINKLARDLRRDEEKVRKARAVPNAVAVDSLFLSDVLAISRTVAVYAMLTIRPLAARSRVLKQVTAAVKEHMSADINHAAKIIACALAQIIDSPLCQRLGRCPEKH